MVVYLNKKRHTLMRSLLWETKAGCVMAGLLQHLYPHLSSIFPSYIEDSAFIIRRKCSENVK